MTFQTPRATDTQLDPPMFVPHQEHLALVATARDAVRQRDEYAAELRRMRSADSDTQKLKRELEDARGKLARGAGVSQREVLEMRESVELKDREIRRLKEANLSRERLLGDSRDKLEGLMHERSALEARLVGRERAVVDFEAKLGSLHAELQAERKRMDEYRVAVGRANTELTQRTRDLEIRTHERDESRKQASESIRVRDAAMEAAKQTHATEATTLAQSHAREVALLRDAIASLETRLTETENALDQTEREMGMRLEGARQDANDGAAKIAGLEEQFASDRAAMTAAHAAALASLGSELEVVVKRARADHEALSIDLETAREALAAAHATQSIQHAELVAGHAREMDALRESHRQASEAGTERFERELAAERAVRTGAESSLADAVREHAAATERNAAEYETRTMELRAAHSADLLAVGETQAAELAAMNAEQIERMRAALDTHATQLAFATAEHEREMRDARAASDGQMDQLLAELSAANADLERALVAAKAEHAAELLALTEAAADKHATELSAHEAAHANAMTALREAHIASLDALNAAHASVIATLAAEHSQSLDARALELTARFDALAADHSAELDALAADHSAELDKLADDRAAERDASAAGHSAELAALMTHHAAQIDALALGHAAEIEKLAEDRSAELETFAANHSDELDELAAEHADELDKAAALHAGELDKAAACHASELDAVAADHSAAIAALSSGSEHALAELQARVTDCETRLASSEKEVRAVSAQRDRYARTLTDTMQRLSEARRRVEAESARTATQLGMLGTLVGELTIALVVQGAYLSAARNQRAIVQPSDVEDSISTAAEHVPDTTAQDLWSARDVLVAQHAGQSLYASEAV